MTRKALTMAMAAAFMVSTAGQSFAAGHGGHSSGGHSSGHSSSHAHVSSGKSSGGSKSFSAKVHTNKVHTNKTVKVYSKGGKGGKGHHFSHRRHHWHGVWYAYGVGSCWVWDDNYGEYYWNCGDDD